MGGGFFGAKGGGSNSAVDPQLADEGQLHVIVAEINGGGDPN